MGTPVHEWVIKCKINDGPICELVSLFVNGLLGNTINDGPVCERISASIIYNINMSAVCHISGMECRIIELLWPE